MEEYQLKVRDEVINRTNAESYELALEYFSKVKNLAKDKLLSIYSLHK